MRGGRVYVELEAAPGTRLEHALDELRTLKADLKIMKFNSDVYFAENNEEPTQVPSRVVDVIKRREN